MAYLKPPMLTARLVNRLVMRTKVWDVHTLEVARRHKGEPQRVPVIPIERHGTVYLVSTRGESDWVKNVRTARRIRLGQKRNLAPYQVHEVPVAERAVILADYRKKVGKEAEKYFAKLPDDSDHPVFRISPA